MQSEKSSYNPFEDEDDTASTVSEKEDNKIKTLVKDCSQTGFHAYTFSIQGFQLRVSTKALSCTVHESLLKSYVIVVVSLPNIPMLYPFFGFLVGCFSLFTVSSKPVCCDTTTEALLLCMLTGCVQNLSCHLTFFSNGYFVPGVSCYLGH